MPLTNIEFLTGGAGTGKTTLIRQRIKDAKEKGVRNYTTLTATTGIAAINLGGGNEQVTTINSLLKYFDTESLKDAYGNRRLHSALKDVATACRVITIDEASMFEKTQLQLIVQAMDDINEVGYIADKGGVGLLLSGDFLQLPPIVKDKSQDTPYCFLAECWNRVKITKLTKYWRQTDLQFLEMLHAARSGDGEKTAEGLCSIEGISVVNAMSTRFDGTTIVATNKEVDSLNDVRLMNLLENKENSKFEFRSMRWGKQRGEWKGIPEILVVCKNAYVMILSNDYPEFTYANGSCGYIKEANIDTQNVDVELKDNKRLVKIRRITRKNTVKEIPEGCTLPPEAKSKKDFAEEMQLAGVTLTASYKSYLQQLTLQFRLPGVPYYDFVEDKWVVGEVTYLPLRLAYATTVHKSQGLTLDTVQINTTHGFFGSSSMMYVALSRVRTPQGLTVVGNKNVFIDRTNISAEVVEWI